MTRRALFAMPGVLLAQDSDEKKREQWRIKGEFYDLVDDFLSKWKKVMVHMLQDGWDIREATEVEIAFRKMTNHQMWISTYRGKQ